MRIAIAAALIAMLAACGFHPAGSRPLPAQLRKVYLDVVVPYRVSEPPLESSLRARLTRQGAKVTTNAAAALCTIKLTNLKEGRQVLSVGSDGKALEFLLVTTVDYQVFAGAQVLVPPGSLRVSRDYSFREDQILAKEAEEARLREYIQDQLAELVLLKVETQMERQSHIVPSTLSSTPTPAPEAGTAPAGEPDVAPVPDTALPSPAASPSTAAPAP